MNRLLNLTVLMVFAGWLGLSSIDSAIAVEIETRKGEVVTTTPPVPTVPPIDNGVMMLGSIQLPSEVVKKLDSEQLADILEKQVSAPKSTVEHIFNEKVLAPAIVFMSFTVISFFFIYFSYRKRRDMLDTVRTAIQSGQTLPTSVLEALESRSKSKPTPDGDLRKAVLMIALGVSGTIVLALLGEKEVGRAWSVGLVPTLLGVGYLFLWQQSQKRLKAGRNNDH